MHLDCDARYSARLGASANSSSSIRPTTSLSPRRPFPRTVTPGTSPYGKYDTCSARRCARPSPWALRSSGCSKGSAPLRALPSSSSATPEPLRDSAIIADTPPIPPRWSELAMRVVFGVLMGVCAAVAIGMGGRVFTALVAGGAWICSQEYARLIRALCAQTGAEPPSNAAFKLLSALCVALSAWALVWPHYTASNATGALVGPAVAALLTTQVWTAAKPTWSQMSYLAAGLVYCGYFPAAWTSLRSLSTLPALPSLRLPSLGLWASLAAVLGVVAADTGAYFAGRAWGRTPLHPSSPKKTWEGALGGLAAALATVGLTLRCAEWGLGWGPGVALGVLVWAVGAAGDLVESVLKREAGVKDSGTLLPGHGGVLDRCDSHLFGGVAVLWFLSSVLPLIV